MRGRAVIGVVLVLTGIVLLYLLRRLFVELVVLAIGFIGIIIGVAFIVGGLAMIFMPRSRWGTWI